MGYYSYDRFDSYDDFPRRRFTPPRLPTIIYFLINGEEHSLYDVHSSCEQGSFISFTTKTGETMTILRENFVKITSQGRVSIS